MQFFVCMKFAFGVCSLTKQIVKSSLFSRQIYTAGKNLTQPPVVKVAKTSPLHVISILIHYFHHIFLKNGFNSVFRLQYCTHRGSAFLQVKFHYCADDMANFPFKFKIE